MEESNLTGNAPQWVKNITDCYQLSEWEKVYLEIVGKRKKIGMTKKGKNEKAEKNEFEETR